MGEKLESFFKPFSITLWLLLLFFYFLYSMHFFFSLCKQGFHSKFYSLLSLRNHCRDVIEMLLQGCCVCFKSKTLYIFWFSPSSSLLIFWNIGEFGAKKYFTNHRKANTIQLFVATKGNVSSLSFLWSCPSEREFPRDDLINVATCLFAYHYNRH